MFNRIKWVFSAVGMLVLAAVFSGGYAQNPPAGPHSFLSGRPSHTRKPAKKAASQTQTSSAAASPARDPQAVTLANQALKAIAGTVSITDAIIQANSSFTAGSDQESGSATLEAHSGYESRMVLSLSGGPRTEIHNFSTAPPQGKFSGPDGAWQLLALHNCWTDPTWFFPALTLQSALNDPRISFAYIGQETHNGVLVQHIQTARLVLGQSAAATSLIQKLSQADIYLDPTTNLPTALDFNFHPNSDAGTNFPVEIQFSGWHALGGVQAPARIQQFVQGSLALDLSISSVSVNSGVAQGDFTI